jgi:hypothetical protein
VVVPLSHARGAAERDRFAARGRILVLLDKADEELVTEDHGAAGEQDLENYEEIEGYGVVAMTGSLCA